jgi:hypothetical protein
VSLAARSPQPKNNQLRPAQVFPKAQIPVAGAGKSQFSKPVANHRAGLKLKIRQKNFSLYYEYVTRSEILQNILIYFCFPSAAGENPRKIANLTGF